MCLDRSRADEKFRDGINLFLAVKKHLKKELRNPATVHGQAGEEADVNKAPFLRMHAVGYHGNKAS